MSPCSEPNLTNMFLTQTSSVDYKALCRLVLFGLQDHPAGDQGLVHEKFKEKLIRQMDGARLTYSGREIIHFSLTIYVEAWSD